MSPLSAEDQKIVELSVMGLEPDERQAIIASHLQLLSEARRRRTDLEHEIASIDRAIAMREAALVELAAASEVGGSE